MFCPLLNSLNPFLWLHPGIPEPDLEKEAAMKKPAEKGYNLMYSFERKENCPIEEHFGLKWGIWDRQTDCDLRQSVYDLMNDEAEEEASFITKMLLKGTRVVKTSVNLFLELDFGTFG